MVTYEVVLQDQALLSKFKWRAIIIDEGQLLKNVKSKFYQKAFKLDCKLMTLLSSTPLQNDFEELLNLCRFISPENFNNDSNEKLKILFDQSLLAKSKTKLWYKGPESTEIKYDQNDV